MREKSYWQLVLPVPLFGMVYLLGTDNMQVPNWDKKYGQSGTFLEGGGKHEKSDVSQWVI